MGLHTWFYMRGYKSDSKFPLRTRHNNLWYIEAKTPKPITVKVGNAGSTTVIDYYHDLFRISQKDEEVILTSKEQTIKFLKDANITAVNWKRLNEFWDIYPDGLINFG